ncbi:MAG: MoxR family ATPase [bacterium]|nr:MoxR family ATPase [bacterium]MDY4099466.1 MoxR family ATPase [Lachnospiraceae bacterium]
MNIAQAKDEIKHTVQAYLKKDAEGNYRIPSVRQRPILMIGPPGIGKTQIMEQIAEECKVGLVSYTITHHTRQSAVGLPMITQETYEGNTYSVTEYTMSEIIASVYRCMRDEGKKEGILFIDEINCVSETLTPAMLQFLQCKTFGNRAVPQGWIIVAAGNPPEYNKSVRDFDMVTLDRVRSIEVDADLDIWINYAAEKHIYGVILSYLQLRKKNFYRIETDVDGLRFVTARGWEDLSVLMQMYEELDIPVTEDVIGEYLRLPEVAEDFYAYYELYRKYRDDYGIREILRGQAQPAMFERLMKADFDERVSVVNLLLDALKEPLCELFETKCFTGTPQSDTLSAAMTHAFEFLEDAFGTEGSQEMLLFVTGLTMCREAAVFLAMNPQPKYMKYNELLLGGGRRQKLLQEIRSS